MFITRRNKKKHEEGAKKHEGFAGILRDMGHGAGCPKFGMKIFMIDTGFWHPTPYPIIPRTLKTIAYLCISIVGKN
jgi:hypothetical protein